MSRRGGGRRARILVRMAALMLAAVTGGCGRRVAEYQATEMHMGTAVEIAALGPDRAALETAVNGAFTEIARLEAMMSAHRDDSELNAVNRAAGGPAVPVSATQKINLGRLAIRTFGKTSPIETNTTDKGRAMNRRVSIDILGYAQ